jgi:diaminohydroxyphosphoribosylaminopyrimidine deaminase/5-amino-6-(5-phosphoribosylamino)uracil reductase
MTASDEKYMKRCLELARFGLGNVAPNPMVGAVIVYNGFIIGEGYHQKYGGAHAEVNAINSVRDKSLLDKSTLYVNLEPCSHFGKTPPCADLIVERKIPKVVIGTMDTFEKVSGRGAAILEKNGIKVCRGCLEKESREINKRFFTFHEKKRPYVILKWAETADGFIDRVREPGQTEPSWITDEIARMLVHKWRTEEQSIMIGTHTAMMDNPRLNVRSWTGKNPVRIVLDRELKLSSVLHIFDQSQPTLVFTEKKAESGVNPEYIKVRFDDTLLTAIMNECYNRMI